MIFDRRRYGTDNYVYLLADGGDAALVDPGDPEVALALAAAHDVRPRFILHTHGHADHSGGSSALRDRLGATVLGHAADARWFAPDRDVANVPRLALGALVLDVHPVPGHTTGSVLYAWRGRLLTGDTLFWAGCGNCRHGGDPARLAASFLETIAALEGALEVHPGHDYARANLPFAAALEPGSAAVASRAAAVAAAHAAGQEPPPTTLDEERALNPFLRVDVPAIRDALAARARLARDASAAEAFVALRRLRDGWTSAAG